jgi:dihydroflavonol-4-reductase
MITLVTGASGHIGVNLVRALVAQERRVRILVHEHNFPLAGLDIEVVRGDICDPDSLRRALTNVDTVFHLAARISIALDRWTLLERINVTGTRNVVDACLHAGVRRLVHFSSIHAFMQTPLDCPLDETRPPADSLKLPRYDRSKAAGEAEIKKGLQKGLDAVILNPTAVIGPYDYQMSFFGEALLAMANGALPAVVPGGFDWVDARDVAGGAIQAEMKAAAGSRYLLSGHWVSVRDLADMAAELTGVSSPRLVCPAWLARAAAPLATPAARLLKKRPLFTSDSMRALRSNRNISHARATRELGYEPRPFRETLIDTLRWYAENGKLHRPVSPPLQKGD